ncbi:MAG: decarboxylating 6-phosphogluconate dehydrogenase [Alicyclobacillus sp.]|nr:decarboxylating 6-phosphogluconate dehydrogenase [Alicyclobacillus sp.]
MDVGLFGLGKMGFNLGLNLMEHGHRVLAYDLDAAARRRFTEAGGETADSPAAVVAQLASPRTLWLMVPQGNPVDQLLAQLQPSLAAGDVVIDGGNSHYRDTLRRAAALRAQGIAYLDAGTSGGVEGARHGACYMVGGDEEAFRRVEPLFRDTAVAGGYLYTGPAGSGHFAKMVHNGIEYGMMAAVGEGFELLAKSPFAYDLARLAEVWTHGSVIRGWLLELTARALAKDPHLEGIKGVMHSSGEGKWTVEEALDLQVATPVIALSLLMRYRSLSDDTFAGKVVAALRREFGGHAVETR